MDKVNKIVRGDGVDGVGRGKSRRSILRGFWKWAG